MPQDLRADRHRAPAQELHPLCADDLEHLLGLAALEGVLWEEEHADAVVPLPAHCKAAFLNRLGKEFVGDLDQDPHTVAGFTLGVFPGAVLQLFHNLQRFIHGTVAFPPFDVHHRANAAGIVLKAG